MTHWKKAQHLSPGPSFLRSIYEYYPFQKYTPVLGEIPEEDVIQDTIEIPGDNVIPTAPTTDDATNPSATAQEDDNYLPTTTICLENIPEIQLFRQPWTEMIGKNLAENSGTAGPKSVSLTYSQNNWKPRSSAVKNK
ncbi:unnamed protein product, partial [Allacma fusca]